MKIILFILFLGFGIIKAEDNYMPKGKFQIVTSSQKVQMKVYNLINNQLEHTTWKLQQYMSTDTVISSTDTIYKLKSEVRFPKNKLPRAKNLLASATTYLDSVRQYLIKCSIIYEKCRNNMRKPCGSNIIIYQK